MSEREALLAQSRAVVLSALDPSRSVVVEACAGSGKTWLLASRIVCLLLAGSAPGDILAITFTRKAAREIEERVVGWLRFLATGTDEQVATFLAERGVAADFAMQREARGLYERVLGAQPPLTVNTFHGWFLQLVAAAPLSANLAGMTLVDTGSRLFDEHWQSFAATCAKAPESELTQSFVALLETAGMDAARRMLRVAHDRRSDWLAFGEEASGETVADKLAGELQNLLGVGEPGEALAEFFGDRWSDDFEDYLSLLEVSDLKTDASSVADLRAALAAEDPEVRFARLRNVLLTQSNTLRKREVTAASRKRFGDAGAERLVALHTALGERLLISLEQQTAESILQFNRHMARVFAAFLEHVNAYKAARRQLDFVDAEWQVLRLLRDEDTAAFLQARLDARYRHVLLDEFQDTNPLQWQILLAWLAAYSDASRPTVFLVGDPKQSIYRFRRAEPRLFTVAAAFLQRDFGAVRCEQDATRRNAQPIIDVVNALFAEDPVFQPFRQQWSFAEGLPGRVELLPLCAAGDEEHAAERTSLRDPLTEPDHEPEDMRRACEADLVAGKISEIVGKSASGMAWLIDDRAADGGMIRRPARYGDFMLLVRSRTHLAGYERALAAAGIPFEGGARGGLLETLEAQDMVALLSFLVTPVDDLSLAHVLRSPVFACRDADLQSLAMRTEATWWDRLCALVADDEASPHLARARCMLGEWQEIAGTLPAHDLLDRVFHQGEVLARYRMAVPEAVQASVEANLIALLQLALDVDGGRYPSLTRFIDELRELSEADSNESPDFGDIAAGHGDQGRVRILTIHGAKGLEAPIVWLLGANESARSGDAWDVLVDWPPEAPGPRHVSFYGRKEERGRARQPFFELEEIAARREELNLLYVAVTRARQILLASGIDSTRAGDETPYRRLQSAIRRLGDESGRVFGDTIPIGEVPIATDVLASPASDDWIVPSVGEVRETPGAAERFGIVLHALLERASAPDHQAGESEASEPWWRDLGFSDIEYRQARPIADRILAAPSLQRFFDPQFFKRAWNEVEMVCGDGRLLRLDRLVEVADGYWVLDYKSSTSATERLSQYREQVAAYCQSVREIFPGRPVRGLLVFADASLVEVDADSLSPGNLALKSTAEDGLFS